MAKELRQEKMDSWIKHKLNVLLIGKHGTGKTSVIKEAFERNNLKWGYFSAATMDPWVDFVGVPRERQDKLADSFQIVKQLDEFDPNLALSWLKANWKMDDEACKDVLHHTRNLTNKESYLELIRPKDFANDEIEAIFFDEFNRAPKKVRNAVMELMQFKSINGKKFENLKMIWAAINPEPVEGETEPEYDVEVLDPAQKDRFQIHVKIPYEPSASFFAAQFGEQTAKIAIEWWKQLPELTKELVSPRRLEYALQLRKLDADYRDALPDSANQGKLESALKTGHVPDKLAELMKSNDTIGAKNFLINENQYATAIKYIPASETLMAFFLPLCTKEKLAALIADQDSCQKHIINNSDKVPAFKDVCNQIIDAGANRTLIRKIRAAITENKAENDEFKDADGFNKDVSKKIYFSVKPSNSDYGNLLKTFSILDSMPKKMNCYSKIEENIPEKLTADEAVDTLEKLSICFENAYPSFLEQEDHKNLIGIFNHCIKEINRNTGMDWQEILNGHGNKFKALLRKIKEGRKIPELLLIRKTPQAS